MHPLTIPIFHLFLRLGGFGLLALGILDSSFLFMPLGNDLLIVALTARRHELLLYYVAMASAGSVLGCLLVDVVSRKGGEEGLKHLVPRNRLSFVRRHVVEHAGWAVAAASLMPPPFPFTPFVVVAAALQYSRKKLLAVIAVSRAIRFSIAGGLAIVFGRRIIYIANRPAVRYAILGLVALSLAGSVWSIVNWIRKSRAVQRQ